jgi:hypothetical protein
MLLVHLDNDLDNDRDGAKHNWPEKPVREKSRGLSCKDNLSQIDEAPREQS